MSTNVNKAVFIDRDGVILQCAQSKYSSVTESEAKEPSKYLLHRDRLRFQTPKVFDAVKLLNASGYKVFIITNQGCIAKGLLSLSEYYAITSKMLQEFQFWDCSISGVYHCPHHPSVSKCRCRKPSDYLINVARDQHIINISKSWVIGDMYSDLKLAHTAGIRFILTATGFGELTYENHHNKVRYFVPDIFEASKLIIGETERDTINSNGRKWI